MNNKNKESNFTIFVQIILIFVLLLALFYTSPKNIKNHYSKPIKEQVK